MESKNTRTIFKYMIDKNKLVEHICEVILPKHLAIRVWVNSYNEDGSISINYADNLQRIHDEIIKYIENEQ